jgi:DUF4097 and DUF4098 domain-containing protein YvlB
MMMMRSLLSAVVALTLPMSGVAQAQNPPRPPRAPEAPPAANAPQRRDDGRTETTEPFSRNFKVGANAALLVVNMRGDVTVTAGNAGQIEANASRRARSRSEDENRRQLASQQIEVYSTANRVELRAEPRGGNVDTVWDIKVPQDCAVDVRTASGNVRVVNVKGELRITTASGDATLDGTTRIVSIKIVSGDIRITNGGGAAVVSTVSGDVEANGLSAQNFDINTISGDVRLIGWIGERLTARLLSGDFVVDGSLAKGGRFDIETHSGDVRLALSEQTGFELDANTFSGNIRVDFPIKSEGPIRTDGRGPRVVRGAYGDASASLHLQTFGGNITVSRK